MLSKYKYWILIALFVFLMYQDKIVENFETTELVTDVLNKTSELEQSQSDLTADLATANIKNGNINVNRLVFSNKRDGQGSNSGKIDWRGFDEDALGLVGAGESDRKVRIWDKLCIGSTCIGENELKVLTGGKYFSIQSGRSNKRLSDRNRDAKFENDNDGNYEKMRIIKIR